MTMPETANPDKLDGQSQDLLTQRLSAIKAILPEAFDLDGNLVKDKLLEALKPASYQPCDDIPAFGLGWPGKQQAFAAAGVPTTATLRPCPEQSVDFDTTQNLLIEGDNLEVLKTLQRSYHGKVKMIYIDPPYNTGKDFVYPDNYGEGLDTYLKRTQQKDEDGFWLRTNSETSGRKHANWLSMMAPRLTLARNLLREDGVIFISIDDNEVANLRLLCDEVFGAENFIDTIVWKKRYGGGAKEKYLVALHEYKLVYAKAKDKLPNMYIPLEESSIDRYYKFKDEHHSTRGPFRTHPLEAMKSFDIRENLRFPIEAPNGDKVWPKRQWRWGPERVARAQKENEIKFTQNKNGEWALSSKQYLKDDSGEIRKTKPFTIIDDVYTQHGTNEILSIFGDAKIFSFPKPSKLLQQLITIGLNGHNDSIILDFFAGSGTTGHAVMAQNAEDGGDRRYICVQLPEPLDKPVTLDDGVVCETISDLTRERLKRAGNKINEEAGLNADKIDTGLRYFKLDSSNFKSWNSDPTSDESELLDRLDQLTDHTVPDRSETDILWEILLKMGLPLDLELERFEVEGANFIGVAGRTKVISTETSIPTTAFEALLDLDIPPSELMVLDSAFEDDTARANVATFYKQRKDDGDNHPLCNLKVV